MATTSLKIPEDVKRLVLAAARRQGISAHAFMVNAVSVAAVNARKRSEFIASALASREQTSRTGTGYAADSVHEWLRAKAAGQVVERPEPVVWRK